jgi:hypothetical protein
VVAPVSGILFLGLFATGIGMLFTGQPVFLGTEVTAALAVFVYSVVVSAILWALLRLGARLAGRSF